MTDADADRLTPSFLTAAATAGGYGLILLVMFLALFAVPFGIFLLV